MGRRTQQLLMEKFQTDVRRFNHQRILWLLFSTLTILCLVTVGVLWNDLEELNSDPILWAVGLVTSGITIIWWGWTMLLVHKIINYQYSLIRILSDITEDINGLRSEMSESLHDDYH